jgi:hypothetical protein
MPQVLHDEPTGCEIVSVDFRDRDPPPAEVHADVKVCVVLAPDGWIIRGIGHGDEGGPWFLRGDPPEDASGPVPCKTLEFGLVRGIAPLLQGPQEGCFQVRVHRCCCNGECLKLWCAFGDPI